MKKDANAMGSLSIADRCLVFFPRSYRDSDLVAGGVSLARSQV